MLTFDEFVDASGMRQAPEGSNARARLQLSYDAALDWCMAYAPAAPRSTMRAAIWRLGLALTMPDDMRVQREQEAGREVEYLNPATFASAARNSGALWLLSPWRRRRGGIIR